MIALLNLVIPAIIVFLIWWFWLYKPKAVKMIENGEVTVTVENGIYKPDHIAAVVGKPLTIHFQLKDDSHCAKKVILADFNQSVELTKEKITSVTITPEKTGLFQFACPMAMYRGMLEVKDPPARDIVIDGGVYQPNIIHATIGETVNLRFYRKDPSRCAQTVIFPDFNIAEEIPFNEPKLIQIKPEKTGEFAFTCEMGMYQGKLVVEGS